MKSKTEKLIRRFEISLAAAFVITSIFSFVSFAASCSDVRRDVLRMHVIANSDSDEDQILKLKVRDAVLNEGEEIFCSDALNCIGIHTVHVSYYLEGTFL